MFNINRTTKNSYWTKTKYVEKIPFPIGKFSHSILRVKMVICVFMFQSIKFLFFRLLVSSKRAIHLKHLGEMVIRVLLNTMSFSSLHVSRLYLNGPSHSLTQSNKTRVKKVILIRLYEAGPPLVPLDSVIRCRFMYYQTGHDTILYTIQTARVMTRRELLICFFFLLSRTIHLLRDFT